MPYPMTHLCIAYNILSNTRQIKEPCDFLLGAIAPDSVHFRNDFKSSMKKISHLCVGNEVWGEISNNREWLENVLDFLKENINSEKVDFIFGYCCHIIADIQNNKKIWAPFRVANSDESQKGNFNIFGQEGYTVDQILYLLNPNQTKIWETLENAVGFDIVNVVVGNEIDKIKNHILNIQFNDIEPTDLSSYKYVTLASMEEFISTESQYIKEILYQNKLV